MLQRVHSYTRQLTAQLIAAFNAARDPHRPRYTKAVPVLLVSAALLSSAPHAVETAFPGFAELEKAGAVIGKVRVDTQNIFDLDNPEENRLLYRWVNRVHTRPCESELSLSVAVQPSQSH